ncbi:MAG: esterase [Sphingopyxis terrae]|nr:esterase [Sphingopyxis terrae]
MLNRREFAGLAAAGAATSLATPSAPAPAAGTITYHSRASSHVPGEARVAIYLPPGYDADRTEPYPLLLLLHGGNGSEKDLAFFNDVFDREIAGGRLPPLVIATPTGRRSLYMDFRDGSERWESFVLSDVLPFVRRSAHVSQGRERTFIGGWSMGGLGCLRIAFKHPQLFAAVAALEPAIEPALAWKGVGPHTRFWRPEEVLHPIFGNPVDAEYWAQNNPASIASRAPDRLLGLGVYLEVGDQDMLYLYEGAEFLHRVLFDARLAHEYRLVHGAEHIGPSLLPRMADALGFIARQIAPPGWIDQNVLNVRAMLDRSKRSAGLPVEPIDPRRLKNR